jgi:hypothetical protein
MEYSDSKNNFCFNKTNCFDNNDDEQSLSFYFTGYMPTIYLI